MAHFEAKIQEKAIENPKTSAVKGQMLVILRQCAQWTLTKQVGWGTPKTFFKN